MSLKAHSDLFIVGVQYTLTKQIHLISRIGPL